MVSRAARVLLFGAAAALVPAVGAGVLYWQPRDVRVDFVRGYEEAFISGFHAREREGREYFRWTAESSFLELRHLPTTGTFEAEATLRVRRPPGEPLPEIRFTANGVTMHRAAGRPGTSEYRFSFPSVGSRLRLGIDSETFHVGPPGEEGRDLGVQALAFRLHLPPAAPSFLTPIALVALASALWFAAFTAAGWPRPVASASGAALGLVFVVLLAQGSLRYTSYPHRIVVLALGMLALSLVLSFVLHRVRWPRPSERRLVVTVAAAVFVLKMGALSFPFLLSSDADFQANRMLHFLRGDWHPTSVTQHEEPFVIPYPVAMYAAATPLVKLGVSRVEALEILTVLAEVLAALGLILLAGRLLGDLRAGLAAAWLYAVVPMNVYALSAGNFTNLFAVAMAVLAFVFLAVGVTEGDRRHGMLAGVFTFLALTAHFGWSLEAALLLPAWLAAIWLLPAPAGKDERAFATGAVGLGVAAALVYYVGYVPLVADQWRRALEGGGGDGGSVVDRLDAVGAAATGQIGWVFLVVAGLGAASVLRRPGASVVHAMAASWLGVTLVFLALDLATPIEIRYLLQALPLLALLAGMYLSSAWDRGVLGKTAAIGVVAYVSSRGLAALYESMFFRYH